MFLLIPDALEIQIVNLDFCQLEEGNRIKEEMLFNNNKWENNFILCLK